jgi:sterol desaturase/sphingolipid hydroxylase (fatty acid hydroxylase superfamily)
MLNPIALAIPVFFLSIGIEVWVARRRKLAVYRLTDSMVDLASGTLQQVSRIFDTALMIWLYDRLYAHRLIDFKDGLSSPWAWLIAFIGFDLGYYWFHRASHRINFFWASHITHHQSEEYNLSVALRQSLTSAFTSLPFTIWLALCGVPTLVYAIIGSLSLLYQFWIHTELIGKLGWFEWVFNTPSQHRVHHATNPRYLDMNYAGTLCIWDRMFGTFVPESEEAVYGLVKSFGSFQPLWAQFHRYVELAQLSWAAPAFKDKLLVWVKGPEWSVPGLQAFGAPPEVSRATQVKYDPPVSPGLRRYLWVQLVGTMSGAFVLLFFQNQLPFPIVAGGAALVVLSVTCWGGLIEARPWALPLESLRLLLLAAGALAALHQAVPAPALLALVIALTALQGWLLRAGVTQQQEPGQAAAA